MGTQVGVGLGTACYADPADADNAVYGSTTINVVGRPDGGVVETYFYKTAGVWRLRQDIRAANGTATTGFDVLAGTYASVLPSCDPAQNFTDGTVVGWGIASALIFATCVKLMRRAM